MNDLAREFQPYVSWILDVGTRAFGAAPTVTSTRRSFLGQLGLRVRLSDRGQVCRAGHSTHEIGWAVDLVVPQGSRSPQQQWLGRVWNLYVIDTWSGLDPVHFAAVRGCV